MSPTRRIKNAPSEDANVSTDGVAAGRGDKGRIRG